MDMSKCLTQEDVNKINMCTTNIKSFLNAKQEIHGINHHLRVFLYTLLICNKLNMNSESKNVACTAALYHDIGRKHDDMDLTHGLLSWKKAKTIIKEEFNEDDLFLIKYLIENHCIPDNDAYENVKLYPIKKRNKAICLLKILKDSDSLDIMRFGCFEEKYIRIRESKDIIETANFINHLGDDIQNPSHWMPLVNLLKGDSI